MFEKNFKDIQKYLNAIEKLNSHIDFDGLHEVNGQTFFYDSEENSLSAGYCCEDCADWRDTFLADQALRFSKRGQV